MRDRAERNGYYKEYMKRIRAERRLKVIAILGGKCVICGAVEALEIDHVDRATKSVPVADALSWGEGRLLAEVSKCQLLCRVHHHEKNSREFSVEHGGGASGKKNCSCQPCKKRKAEYSAAYKKRRSSSGSRAAAS